VCSRKFYAERITRHVEACERARDKAKEREKILKRKGLKEAAHSKVEEQKSGRNSAFENASFRKAKGSAQVEARARGILADCQIQPEVKGS
jgi:hypothetical protein